MRVELEFARAVYSLAQALGHLWATRGPEVYEAARLGREEDLPVAPEDLEHLHPLAEVLRRFPSFEALLLAPEGREALNKAVDLTVHPSLPGGTPLWLGETREGGLAWRHTTGGGRGEFSLTLTPSGVLEGVMEVCRPAGVAIHLSWTWREGASLVHVRLESDFRAPARPRHWAFLGGVLERAAEGSEMLAEVRAMVAPLVARWTSRERIERALREAAAAFHRAVERALEGASPEVRGNLLWALEKLERYGLGGGEPQPVGLEEAARELYEAIRDAEEVLGMDLMDLGWAVRRVLEGARQEAF